MLGHCPPGPVRMGTKGSATYTPVEILGRPVYADVDRDGALETVINLTCSPQGSAQQVLAYDRDIAGGIYLLGKVVGTAGPNGRQGIDIERVHRIAAAADGRVNADVGDFFTCCGDNPDSHSTNGAATAGTGRGLSRSTALPSSARTPMSPTWRSPRRT
jgi:hypothetical protein